MNASAGHKLLLTYQLCLTIFTLICIVFTILLGPSPQTVFALAVMEYAVGVSKFGKTL